MVKSNYIEAAECLKVLAHPSRLEILNLLRMGPMKVGEIAQALDLKSHVTSEHLRLMLRCGFLNSQRNGRNISYSIKELELLNILDCMESKFKETT